MNLPNSERRAPAPRLNAHPGFWKLTPAQRAKVCNGCGAKNGVTSKFIPNSIWFLVIKICCDIHDYDYHIGETLEDKEQADRRLLNNLLRMIDYYAAQSFWASALAPLRRRRAFKMYEAVRYLGGPAFWDGKNRPEEMGSAP